VAAAAERGASPGSTQVAADPAAAAGDGDSETVLYVLGGFAALAAGLAAGFLWYRRRLP
jgi:LPXTG-motif cell wall-anchored protein